MKFEHGFSTMQDISYRSCRYTGYQQRKQGTHGQVNHQHFERKDQSGNRGLEDTRYRTGCTTSNQQHQGAMLHLESTT